MLLKGLEEAASAPNQPAAAAEMVLIRLAFTADLPPPDDIDQGAGRRCPARPARALRPRPHRRPRSAPGRRRAAMLPTRPTTARSDVADEDAASELARLPPCRSCARSPTWWRWPARGARPSSRCTWKSTSASCEFEPAGHIELHLLPGAPKELANELREKLNAWTGKRWMVALSKTPGERHHRRGRAREAAAEIARDPEAPGGGGGAAAVPRRRRSPALRPLPGTEKDDTGTG